MDKQELVVVALQQRIGELTTEYETKIAILRAELTMLMQQQEKQKAAEEYSSNIEEKINNI